MARKVDVTRKMGATAGENLAQEGELTDAAVLHLNVTEAVESLLIHVLEHAERIEEAKGGLHAKLTIESVQAGGMLTGPFAHIPSSGSRVQWL